MNNGNVIPITNCPLLLMNCKCGFGLKIVAVTACMSHKSDCEIQFWRSVKQYFDKTQNRDAQRKKIALIILLGTKIWETFSTFVGAMFE